MDHKVMKTDMSRFFFFCLFLMFPFLSFAQVKEVTFVVKSVTTNDLKKKWKGTIPESALEGLPPVNGITIIGFHQLNKAVDVFNGLKKKTLTSDQAKEMADVVEETQGGLAKMNISIAGAVIVINPFSPDTHDQEFQRLGEKLKYTLVIENTDNMMKEHTTTINRKPRPISIPPSKRYDNTKKMDPFPYFISEKYTRSNGRFGLSPQFIGVEDGDTLCTWRPFIKDGKQFSDTQLRRMGYNMDNDLFNVHRNNDTIQYIEPGYMEDHEPSTVTFYWELTVPDGKHYKVVADRWGEDYNGTYLLDKDMLDEGFDQEPLRFLEFKVKGIDIKPERYRIVTEAKDRKSELDLHFKFKVNEAVLEEGDSINDAEKLRLTETFGTAVNDQNSVVDQVFIIGKSSPEGDYTHNLSLSTKRAAFVQSFVRERFPSSYIRYAAPKAVVATWEEVADTLEQVYGEREKAAEIRAIVKSSSSITAQNQRIYRLPYYENYLKTEILPLFRVVTFSYTAIIKKLLTKEEVLRFYELDPEYRKPTKRKDPYEYAFLFEYLANRPKELEEMARQAFEDKGIREGNDDSITRPWPLAAFYLANCRLNRGIKDTRMLNPYMSNKYPLDASSYNKRNVLQWWNDEAIVTTQIAMFCAKPNADHRKAKILAFNYLKDDPKYDQLKLFLRCYGEEQDSLVREAVAATSPMNKIVIYAAQDNRPDLWREALKICDNDSLLNPSEFKVKYMKANLMFRCFAASDPSEYFQLKAFFPNKEEVEEPDSIKYAGLSASEIAFIKNFEEADAKKKSPEEIEAERNAHWGYPMIEACMKDSQGLGLLKSDGYFDSRYRKAFFFVWENMKNGVTEEEMLNRWRELPKEEKK